MDRKGKETFFYKNEVKKEEDEILKYPRKLSRGKNYIEVKSTLTQKRYDVEKWNGWGYVDSYFHMKNNAFLFTGNRYSIPSSPMPYCKHWVKLKLDMDVPETVDISEDLPKDFVYPKSLITEAQLSKLKQLGLPISIEGLDRFIRSHGQGNDEFHKVIDNEMERIPDCVIWPTCHEDVVEIIKICDEQNIVIIPIGGATNVTEALVCPLEEKRPILSLDTTSMNDILWYDEESLVVCCESGIIGQDMERELNKLGYTVGHEPDSIEFSTLGGWVATRASGMKKNAYGNIEDIVVQVKMATPRGILERKNRVPRLSCGPEFNHVILGSEGNLGVITEVVLKIRPVPSCSKFGSILFPDFESGVACMRKITKHQTQPASLRLMDNNMLGFARCFRVESNYIQQLTESFSKFYLTKIKGFDTNKMVIATIKYEAEEDVVNAQEKKLNSIAAEFGGISIGGKDGEVGYNITFAIAYIRDMGYALGIYGDTIECSVSWDKLFSMLYHFRKKVAEECQKLGIKNHEISTRLAQVYDAGACIYSYFNFNINGLENPHDLNNKVINAARVAILESGGSISHHHGVGKIRKKWYQDTVSPLGVELFKACKSKLDPKNIFAVSNLTS